MEEGSTFMQMVSSTRENSKMELGKAKGYGKRAKILLQTCMTENGKMI